ncbi:MAG: glycosyltransferase family 2 protein [Candidatus Brocadiales bacterium]
MNTINTIVKSTKKDEAVDISVVIPLLNEAKSLEELYSRLVQSLSSVSNNYELIFIDDGSNDDSFNVLEQLHEDDPKVKIIQLRRNYGKSAALSTGFREARGEVVITMDADLQDLPEEIPNLIAKLNEGYDLITGWRVKRLDPFMKKFTSKVFNMMASLLTGLPIHDLNCGFKAYQRIVIKELKIYGELHRFLPLLAHCEGFKVGEQELRHAVRKHGKTKYNSTRFFKGFFDLLTVLFLNKYLGSPLHFFGLFGIFFLFTGIGINSYITFLRMSFGNIQNRYPLLFLGILLVVIGIQFITTGLLGEMLADIHQENKETPKIRCIRRKLSEKVLSSSIKDSSNHE